jgi:ribonuclease HI
LILAVNWNATQFWIDGGCRGNHHRRGPREAYGSISDGEAVERFKLPNAHTSNEAEYITLSVLLENLLHAHIDSQKPPTKIYTDSKLLLGQLTQNWKVEADNLLPLYNEVAPRVRRSGAKLIWVRRDQIVKRLGH